MNYFIQIFVCFLLVFGHVIGATKFNKLTIFIEQQDEFHNAKTVAKAFDGDVSSDKNSLPVDLCYALHQKASPILCVNAHIFEHLLLRMIVFATVNEKNPVLGKCFTHIEASKREIIDYCKHKNITVEELYKKYSERCNYIKGLPDFRESYLLDIALFHFLQDIEKNWLIFQYQSSQNNAKATAYLLIPGDIKSLIGANGINRCVVNNLLISHGIEPLYFSLKSLSDIATEIEKNTGYSKYALSTHIKSISKEEFSSGVIQMIDEILIENPTISRAWYGIGHGNLDNTFMWTNSILGLSPKVFLQEFLPLFVKKNVTTAFLNSCRLAGVYRDRIKDYVDRLKIKHGANYKTNIIIGGMPDCDTEVIHPCIYSFQDQQKFQEELALVDANDDCALNVIPFFQCIRFDKFFKSFDFIQKTQTTDTFLQQYLAKSLETSSYLWGQFVKYIVPFSLKNMSYSNTCIPQMMFAADDKGFQVLDFDKSVEIVRKEDNLVHNIRLDNKKAFVVEPLYFNQQITMYGNPPAIMPTQSGDSYTLFKKIVIKENVPLSAAINTLFFAEYGKRPYGRLFWVEEFICGELVLHDLLVAHNAETDFIKIYYHRLLPSTNSSAKVLYKYDRKMAQEIKIAHLPHEIRWFEEQKNFLQQGFSV